MDSNTSNIGSRGGSMIEYVEMTVTCHTAGCENNGVEITLPCALPDCTVICGVCNFEIEDKEQATQ